jgi:hypothetical protein
MATRYKRSRPRIVAVASKLRGRSVRKAFGPTFTVAAAMATAKSKRGRR